MKRRLAAFAASCLVALAILELALRLAPEFPGMRLANATWSRYGRFPGGIYARERASGVYFMWPSQRVENYWNGHRWRHATDSLGFRNPEGASHDVLLLGDSLIYGHGVDEEATVAHFLRSEHGIGAYNMGRQGACFYDQYVYLRTFAAELRPRTIVLFVFLNDFDDLEVYRSAEKIATLPETAYDYAGIRRWAATLAERRPGAVRSFFASLPSFRLLRGVAKSLSGPVGFATPAWAASKPETPLPANAPPYLAPLASDERFAAIRDYYFRLFDDLRSRDGVRGSRILWVFLDAGSDARGFPREQGRGMRLLDDLAARFDGAAFDTRPIYADCGDCFLPRDGHYTAAGHRRLARFVADALGAELPSRAAPPSAAR